MLKNTSADSQTILDDVAVHYYVNTIIRDQLSSVQAYNRRQVCDNLHISQASFEPHTFLPRNQPPHQHQPKRGLRSLCTFPTSLDSPVGISRADCTLLRTRCGNSCGLHTTSEETKNTATTHKGLLLCYVDVLCVLVLCGGIGQLLLQLGV